MNALTPVNRAFMSTFFLSDLHLSPERPELANAFIGFLKSYASQADAIYLLGDLFEYWIGDDAAQVIGATPILDAMKQASEQTDCYFIAGNRDFLVGPEFEKVSGFKILKDETVIDLYGTPTLILHGDSMCTDDTAHMKFRDEIVNNEPVKQFLLSLSIDERIKQAMSAREQSHEHKASVSMQIMDVNSQSIEKAFVDHNVKQMIHGHTHRQNKHTHSNDCARYVLGDWGDTASILIANAQGLEIINQAIPA